MLTREKVEEELMNVEEIIIGLIHEARKHGHGPNKSEHDSWSVILQSLLYHADRQDKIKGTAELAMYGARVKNLLITYRSGKWVSEQVTA